MYVIIGGAYQGKLEYAKVRFGLADESIMDCSEDKEPDFSKKCLYHIERYVLFCLRNNIDPTISLSQWKDANCDGVLICEDIFCGVVPIDEEARTWREATGRFLSWVAGTANGVVRVFCGLPQVLK